VYGVSEFLAQRGLLLVVGQLEEVEAGGGGGQAAHGLALADVEEALQHAAHCVTRVLQIADTLINTVKIFLFVEHLVS